mgnify:CR=1 FL=1
MEAELILTRLTVLRENAENQSSSIVRLREELRSKVAELESSVRDYNSLRIDLLMERLRERGLSWCTYHKNTFPVEEASLVLLSSADSGFSGPHRVCSECRKEVLAKHGYLSRRDDLHERGGILYHAFVVSEEGDGFSVVKFGKQESLAAKDFKVPQISDSAISHFESEMSLPLELSIENHPRSVPLRVRGERLKAA